MAAEAKNSEWAALSERSELTGRRGELAKAAFDLIAERGISGLSLRAVARRLDATTGLVSHHFADKSELILAALSHARRRTRELGLGAASAPAAVDALLTVVPSEPETIQLWRVWEMIRTGALTDPAIAEFSSERTLVWHASFMWHLQRARDAGEPLPQGDLAASADHLIAVVDGIGRRAITEPGSWTHDRMREHLLRALASISTDPGYYWDTRDN